MAQKAPMTLATGNSRRRSGRSGFTLIEILLVIALIALASSVVIVNFIAFTDRGDDSSPEEVLTVARMAMRAMTIRISIKLKPAWRGRM